MGLKKFGEVILIMVLLIISIISILLCIHGELVIGIIGVLGCIIMINAHVTFQIAKKLGIE